MSEPARCVTHGIAILADEDGYQQQLSVQLAYDPAQPYTVTLTYGLHSGQPIAWIFARDLLADGLYGRAGHGDVHVWPLEGHDGSDLIGIGLNSPDGAYVLAVPRHVITSFLRAAYASVSMGRESEHLDIDAGLAALLEANGRHS